MARLGFKPESWSLSLRAHAASQIAQLEGSAPWGAGQYGRGQEDADEMEDGHRQCSSDPRWPEQGSASKVQGLGVQEVNAENCVTLCAHSLRAEVSASASQSSSCDLGPW